MIAKLKMILAPPSPCDTHVAHLQLLKSNYHLKSWWPEDDKTLTILIMRVRLSNANPVVAKVGRETLPGLAKCFPLWTLSADWQYLVRATPEEGLC